MHLVIYGPPGAGKTTFIRTFSKTLDSVDGFYTEELCINGTRQGFKIKTFSGEKEVLFAQKGRDSPCKVGAYGLDLDAFEKTAIDCLEQALSSKIKFILIDEIGRMELFSEKFQKELSRAFETKQVIATMPDKYDHPFLGKLKKRKDVCFIKLCRDNYALVWEKAELWLKALDCAKIKALDQKARDMGLSETLLIENAASNLACFVETIAKDKNLLVVSGRGNNGADVLSCCRKLYSRGYKVKAVIISDKDLNREVEFQKKILEKFIPVKMIRKEKEIFLLKKMCGQSGLILEGLLGTGIRGKVKGIPAQAIEIINDSAKKVISCDIPSGLLPDLGYSLGSTVRADWTVTFLAPKKGFFLNRGQEFCGRIILTDIGISRSALTDMG